MLSFLRCIDGVGKKRTHITLFFFLSSAFSGVCATSTVLKPTSILFVLPMGNLMIMHVKSKRHHARNRRKLKSCLWVDVKVTLITKLISKNVFNFCSGKKKKKKNWGCLLIWHFLRFHQAAVMCMVHGAGACFSSAGLMRCQRCLEGSFVNASCRLAMFAMTAMLLPAWLLRCSVTRP